MVSYPPQDPGSAVLPATGQKGHNNQETIMENLLTKPAVLPLAHTLIKGAPGSGKTPVLHHIIREVAPFVEAGEAELYGIDTTVLELRPYGHSTLFKDLALNAEEAVSLIADLHGQLNERLRQEEPTPTVLVIDNLEALLLLLTGLVGEPNHADTLTQLSELLVKGRACGIYVVATVLGTNGTRLRAIADQFQTVAVMQDGEALVDRPEIKLKMKFPYIADEELAALVRQHWKDAA